MNDLIRLNPRVVRGGERWLEATGQDNLPAEVAASLRNVHDRFALVIENASEDLRAAGSALESLDVIVLPLPRLEKDVERHLLLNLPVEPQTGLSTLTDVLGGVIRSYLGDPLDGFLDATATAAGRALVMGVLNTTPDSFSDGGLYYDESAAARHAMAMLDEGADIIDVGGCSTRPGSEEPSVEDEIRRTVPVIERIRAAGDATISIDTWRAEVAQRALDAGANLVNDVTALSDPQMPSLIAERGTPVVLMHMKGAPRTMQNNPSYDDLVGEITRFLRRAVARAVEAGIDHRRIAIDPGFGFGKTVEHNLAMLRRLGEFRSLGRPVLIGTSRKSTIGHILDRPVDRREMGTAATVALSVAMGASIVRVHDVARMRDVVRMTEAVLESDD